VHPDGYFALVLTEASARLIEARFATLARPIAHHCTVRYGTCDPADLPPPFAAADLGRTFLLQVTGVATRADGGVQAAVVALLVDGGRRIERGFSENAVPHVTVATDGVTEPVAANALLAEGFAPIDGPVIAATLLHTRASSR
jgi:hypothetical protein